MAQSARLFAALAAGGVVTGGAAALAHTGPGNDAATPRTGAAMVALARSGENHASLVSSTDREVRQLLSEAGGLQADIASARAQLDRALAASTAAPTLPGTSEASTPSTAAPDPTLAAERQQLAAQQATLTVERQQLANEAQQLAAEQAQLQREAAALAAAQQSNTPTSPAPPVHTTTGATTVSGSTDS